MMGGFIRGCERMSSLELTQTTIDEIYAETWTLMAFEKTQIDDDDGYCDGDDNDYDGNNDSDDDYEEEGDREKLTKHRTKLPMFI